MNGIRVLTAAVAYSVIILEIYSGVINGPWWWVIPGGLVIALLFAITMMPQAGGEPKGGAGQWIVILILSFAMSAGAWYFGNTIIPDLIAEPVFPQDAAPAAHPAAGPALGAPAH